MSNSLKTLFDYRENKAPVKLEEWLRKHKEELYNHRLLYVLKANMDTNTIKFGIAGVDSGGSSGYGRLHQYVILYGEHNKSNKCMGVRLFYLLGNKFNRFVTPSNSAVFRKELYIKRELKGKSETVIERGTERTKIPITRLVNMIENSSNKTSDDIEKEIKRSERIVQSEIKPSDTVVIILDSINTGKTAKTKYLTEWNRAYVNSKTGEMDNTTYEPYSTLEFINNGKEAVAAFKKLYPKRAYRD